MREEKDVGETLRELLHSCMENTLRSLFNGLCGVERRFLLEGHFQVSRFYSRRLRHPPLPPRRPSQRHVDSPPPPSSLPSGVMGLKGPSGGFNRKDLKDITKGERNQLSNGLRLHQAGQLRLAACTGGKLKQIQKSIESHEVLHSRTTR